MTVWRSALAVCALTFHFATGAIAQPSAQLANALATAEARQADTSLSLREREQAMDRAFDLRRQLIGQAADSDERLPVWLIDQAAASLARLARDGADTAVLFGIPLPAQRQSARQAAGSSLDLLTRAATLLPPTEPAVEDRHEQDRTIRIPYYRARAELLLARLADEAADRHRRAVAAGDHIGSLSLTHPGAEATRRVNAGLSRLLRNASAEDAQIALDEFAWIITRTPGQGESGEISPITRAEAWMGLLHASAALGRSDALLERYHEATARPPFVSEGSADPLLTVLAADAATAALVAEGIAGNNPDLLGRAAREQSRLLHRTDLPMRAEALRPLVYEKLAILAADIHRQRPNLQLPADMQTARAVILARDPQQRDRALGLLRSALAATLPGEFAPDTRWELAVLLTQSDTASFADRLEAASLLTDLAERFPSHPRAPEAMSAALAFARSAHADATDEHSTRALDTYSRALTLATTEYTRIDEIDLWRYERARLLYADAQGARGDADPLALADSLAQALDIIQPITQDSRLATQVSQLAERLHALRLDTLWKPAGEARLRSASAAAAELILPAARAAAAWARANDSTHLERFRLDLADALSLAGGRSTADARALYDEIIPKLDTPELRHLLPRARLGKARTLLETDPAAAFALLRTNAQQLEPRIAAAMNHSGTAGQIAAMDPPTHDHFWESWTLMLELVSAQNDNPERQSQIRIHIRRLETLDPSLGGPPWQARIRATID